MLCYIMTSRYIQGRQYVPGIDKRRRFTIRCLFFYYVYNF